MTATTTSKPPINIVLRRKPLIKEKCMKYRNFSSLVGTMDSRWPTRRLQYAAEVIVDALKAKKEDKRGQEGMTRQDVRDAARMHIGDTGLLDYVLKSMNNVVVGKYVVQRAVNPKTRILEYSIEEFGDGIIPVKSEPESETVPAQPLLPGADVNADVIEHMENLDDKDLLCKFVESGAEIFVKGYGMDINSQLRYEGGSDNWKVRCECGACDDDGERMVECDICEVWQHTRCNGIDDADTVPQLFICSGCCDSLLPGKTETHQRFESSDDLLMIPPAIGYGAEAAEPFYQASMRFDNDALVDMS
ncbi:hypothetical protein D5086_031128 [Populus alba]|uniref:Uncharacterized protein n=1 Tax=Populus alba TaxID=43335 RepID=A0ACC4ARE7_POPAL